MILAKGGLYRTHIENYLDGQIMRLMIDHREVIMAEDPQLEDDEDLGGHLKSGHVWSLENRP